MNELIKQETPAPVQITEDIQVSLNRLGRELETHAESGIRIGKELLHLKDITPHGKFGELVEWAYGLKKDTRANYMNVALKFGESSTRVDFSSRVLIELSRPSVPDSAREEAQELAESGETVTVKKAKEIATDHKELEELKAKLAEKEEQLKRSNITKGDLLTKLSELSTQQPTNYPLIPEVQKLLDSGDIMPAKAKALQTLTPDGQGVWFTEFMSKFSLENQLNEERRSAQKANEKALKAIEEKEAAIAKLSEITNNPETAQIIAKHELQLKQMREEYQMKLHQERKQMAKEASEFQAKMHREKIEKAEKEKALAEKREQEAKTKASAAWKSNDELIRENKKLKSQLEVDNPTNIDNSRALKLVDELKHLDWTFPDIKAEAELAAGEMHETKKLIIEIINRWSSLLQELDDQAIINITN